MFGGRLIARGIGASSGRWVKNYAVPVSSRLFASAAGADHGPATGLHFIPKEVVTQRILKVVSEFDKVSKEVTDSSHFVNDLGLDSLDVVEVVLAIEQEFNVDLSNQDAEKIQSVAEAIEVFSQHPQAQ
eukprot:NODE_5138_length_714_cov_109.777444_g4771_i0.p1 GENE.NODE_5138_length_714_cov_109.777444_g4771_i0~~NODE_5138_length_714_cov_109.777444_g4771_i0.p1  ORF type:complete len:129 (-),score=32.10 NODE_5138_length_714_cov_109.777444_g4771_i0:261-647(-)